MATHGQNLANEFVVNGEYKSLGTQLQRSNISQSNSMEFVALDQGFSGPVDFSNGSNEQAKLVCKRGSIECWSLIDKVTDFRKYVGCSDLLAKAKHTLPQKFDIRGCKHLDALKYQQELWVGLGYEPEK